MTESWQNDGVVVALLRRFETQRLPRLLDLKKKVDAGDTLNDWDLSFLNEILADNTRVGALVEKYPEFQGMVTRSMNLYKEVVEKASENAKTDQDRKS